MKCCRGRWGCRGSSTNGPVGMGRGKPAWKKKRLAKLTLYLLSEVNFLQLLFVHSDSEQSNDCDFDIPWDRGGVQHFLVQLLFSYIESSWKRLPHQARMNCVKDTSADPNQI